MLEAGSQYGENIIKDYSIRLTNELGKGYSQRNLRSMRQFYKVSQNGRQCLPNQKRLETEINKQ